MALLFCDSVDHYLTADILKKWSALIAGISPTVVTATTTPPGGEASILSCVGGVSAAGVKRDWTPRPATVIIGEWVYFVTVPGATAAFLFTLDGVTVQVGVAGNGAGLLTVVRGTTVLATSIVAVSAGTWYHLELKVLIHPSAGAYELRLNGVPIIGPTTGVDTTNTANAYATGMGAQSYAGGPQSQHKHIFALDDTGSVANDFIGPALVTALRPKAIGNYSQWTPVTGPNFAMVDEIAGNSDIDFNMSVTPNQMDSFGMDDVPIASGTVYGIQHIIMARHDGGATRQVASLQRSGGTDYIGATGTLTASYLCYLDPKSVNPATGVGYILNDINSMEAGYRLIT